MLWFPFFFAAAFSVSGLLAFHHPAPHHVQIAVAEGPDSDTTRTTITALEPRFGTDAFTLTPQASAAEARAAVAEGRAAAAIDGDTVYVASAASPTRADFLTQIAPDLTPGNTRVVDLVPTAAGDISGVSLFFYALPLLLVGLITSIVLLQLGPWRVRNKVITIAATGAFASVFAYLVATTLDAIPADPRLVLYGFILTQAIGWLTTAAALSLRQYFMPAAMTFVLILGIPTSGATVNADMLPPALHWLHSVLPLGQFIDTARASAYLHTTSVTRPLLGLVVWAATGAALLALAARKARHTARARTSS